ncbi:tetratricopeptide (TPR) repeat protein [Actinokineospora baliensis]|uniref:tetratricopeptide repeat protein n=1 Tax=Actinokineospora baliensis TaxID=547056 RepID=UPI0019568247|nr:tetratricopeptide repeat protein [Actinokineospora baliensis]MBM7770054.1 tetratricopeptide (TPR) repeat protein [Actinokineospora baliensis]
MTEEFAWLLRYDDRGDVLLEAAHAKRRAGEPTAAIGYLDEAIALGGEDRGFARVALADLLFELGRYDDAATQLEALRTELPVYPAPCELAAELHTTRGDKHEALHWYSLAIANLPAHEIAELDQSTGASSYANSLLIARRRVRHALGYAPDDWDNCVIPADTAIRGRHIRR